MSEASGSTPPAEEEDVTWQLYAFDLASSAGAVILVGALLFAVSGVWPPMVAIESDSMDPQIQVGDLVFVMDEERFHGDGAHESGVVAAQIGAETGYTTFQRPGDVIVYAPNGNTGRTPIIHRAMFWVEAGENWYDRANPDHLGGADSCAEIGDNCPADHAGFVTKGDNNGQYDQVGRGALSGLVRPEWVIGTAEVRVPKLGEIRLRSAGLGASAHDGRNDPANASVSSGNRSGANETVVAASG